MRACVWQHQHLLPWPLRLSISVYSPRKYMHSPFYFLDGRMCSSPFANFFRHIPRQLFALYCSSQPQPYQHSKILLIVNAQSVKWIKATHLGARHLIFNETKLWHKLWISHSHNFLGLLSKIIFLGEKKSLTKHFLAYRHCWFRAEDIWVDGRPRLLGEESPILREDCYTYIPPTFWIYGSAEVFRIGSLISRF